MRTLAVMNQKGGCGKTTTSINLAAALAGMGVKTLLVDLDPQSHCAAGLAVPESKIDRDIGDAMVGGTEHPIDPQRLLWRVAKNLDLAPSRTKLAGLEASRGGLATASQRERRLEQALSVLHRHGGYEVCIIDCAPAIGLLAYNALTAAREVLIPVETSFFSLQGAQKQVSTIRSIGRRLGRRHAYRLLATIHNPELELAQDLYDELKRRFGAKVLDRPIRMDDRVKEAASYGQPLAEFAPSSPAAEDYRWLAGWLIEHAGITAEASDTESDDGEEGPGEIEVMTGEMRGLSARRRASESEPRAWSEVRGHAGVGAGREPQGGDRGRALAAATAATAVAEGIHAVSAEALGANGALSRVQDLTDRLAALKGRAAGAEPEIEVKETAGALRLVGPRPVQPPESVQRLYGVRRMETRALFVQPLATGQRVFVAGSFNGWSATSHPMRRNDVLGVHELTLELPRGESHEYRLVVDGQWRVDDHNPQRSVNQFGEQNCMIPQGAP